MKRLWLAIIVLLLGFLSWRWYKPPQMPQTASYVISEQTQGDIKTLLDSMERSSDFPPLPAYSSISERPLFFSDRRPPQPYVAEAVVPRTPNQPKRRAGKRQLQVSGIVQVGNQLYALLTGGEIPDVRRVSVGDDVDGWKVTSIGTDRLILSKGTGDKTLLVRSYKPVLPSQQAQKNSGGRAQTRKLKPRRNNNGLQGAVSRAASAPPR
ncbi:MAG TPA: hypothetical protein ENG92_06150 [Thiolapillus brandeum]|uniref:Type II secretion system protein GspC N-terminal domain-containing protein n=1 Tax=Thiolapillus brandeum TaxID=1076588 RepID=A0A831KDT3_9GAMM|nr:hypothetical protein [Thiolapillus brandeum]